MIDVGVSASLVRVSMEDRRGRPSSTIVMCIPQTGPTREFSSFLDLTPRPV
jgi:hypothetical protein